jgi:hypothetical protein
MSFLVTQGRELLLLQRMQPFPAQGGLIPVQEKGPQMIKIQQFHCKLTAATTVATTVADH